MRKPIKKINKLKMNVVHRSRKENAREIRHLIAGEGCKESIGKIYKGMEIFGLNGGQYSIINIIEHILEQTGNADVDISTWSAANVEIKIAENLLISNKIKNLRFLLDRGFPSRQPKYYNMLMKRFGEKSVRLARIHCKFIIIRNKKWNITIRTSMNLNENRRLENFEISDDLNLCKYLTEIIDEYFGNPLDYKGYDIVKKMKNKSKIIEEFKELNIRLNENNAGEFDWDMLANEFETEESTDWGFTEEELGFDMEPVNIDEQHRSKL